MVFASLLISCSSCDDAPKMPEYVQCFPNHEIDTCLCARYELTEENKGRISDLESYPFIDCAKNGVFFPFDDWTNLDTYLEEMRHYLIDKKSEKKLESFRSHIR